MNFERMKAGIIGGWLLFLGAVTVAVDLGSPGASIALVGMGLLPLLVILRLWNHPPKTITERIREARR